MKQILLVEDEFVIAFSISNFLTRLGYTVTTGITEGWEIIEFLKQNDYDLVLMNVRMQSGLDGIELMAEIRTFSSIPVIYITGVTDKLTRERAKKTKPAGFVNKPVDFNELKNVIEQGWETPPPALA